MNEPAIEFQRFNEEARRALFFARAAVTLHGGDAIADAHLAIGIVQVSGTRLVAALTPPHTPQTLSESLLAAVSGAVLPPESVEVPFDACATRVLAAAVAMADANGEREIAARHLLLALLEADCGPGAASLRAAGVTRETVESSWRANSDEEAADARLN